MFLRFRQQSPWHSFCPQRQSRDDVTGFVEHNHRLYPISGYICFTHHLKITVPLHMAWHQLYNKFKAMVNKMRTAVHPKDFMPRYINANRYITNIQPSINSYIWQEFFIESLIRGASSTGSPFFLVLTSPLLTYVTLRSHDTAWVLEVSTLF